MKEPVQDEWAAWLLERRHGGDEERLKETLDFLAPVRDRVLRDAALSEGETLLDVGAGDGLVAFGALERVGDGGVVFSDVSQDLLDHSRALAAQMGVLERCRFLLAPADDLSALEDATVDAVTTRSVLIYVEDKARAFGEFHRVLKPGGRLSIFEPINRFRKPTPPHLFLGYDVTPVQDLAQRVWAVYKRLQPMDSDPMLDFDERDLLDLSEHTGFKEIHLNYEAKIVPGNILGMKTVGWDDFLRFAGNPKVPTIGEAMDEALTPEETQRFEAHLRPLVENARRIETSAVAYLWAVKGEG
jgi:ubiquinone/menaquinone biosynthesis C-methylase UbiE